MSFPEFLFLLFVFIFSAIIHEVSHGYVAERLGDPTARLAGRLTLNPINHLDPFGSVILPLLLALPALFGQPTVIFGWAKPVPYNPYNLKNPRSGSALIALAGPASNLIVAGIFGIGLRILPVLHYNFVPVLAVLFGLIVEVNILLAVFNLIPVPPLDGSKILFAALPQKEGVIRTMRFLEQYGMIIILILLVSGLLSYLLPLIDLLFKLFTGISLY